MRVVCELLCFGFLVRFWIIEVSKQAHTHIHTAIQQWVVAHIYSIHKQQNCVFAFYNWLAGWLAVLGWYNVIRTSVLLLLLLVSQPCWVFYGSATSSSWLVGCIIFGHTRQVCFILCWAVVLNVCVFFSRNNNIDRYGYWRGLTLSIFKQRVLRRGGYTEFWHGML